MPPQRLFNWLEMAVAIFLSGVLISRATAAYSAGLANGTLRIEACTDRIVHVTLTPTGRPAPPPTPWIIPATAELVQDDTPAGTELSTASLRILIDRQTVGLTFLNREQHVVLTAPTTANALLAVTVNGEQTFSPRQVFTLADREKLFGLGQYQDGLWDWRGIPLQLRQFNTSVSVPFVVSSKGYGLLWNNAAQTGVNPSTQEILLDPESYTGFFESNDAGEYAFFVETPGDLKVRWRGELRLDDIVIINHHEVNLPPGVAGRATLPGGKRFRVSMTEVGKKDMRQRVRVFARRIDDTTTFCSEVGDAIDYYFIYGPSMDEIVAGYRRLTGPAPMLPKWAFGYWQCKERYNSQTEMLEAAVEFRKRKFPVDVMVQDWRYWPEKEWSSARFDPERFPDPAAMIKTLHDDGFHYAISVWANPQGSMGDELASRHFVLPGTKWYDPFNPQARDFYWATLRDNPFKYGVDGWWQDATEPEDDPLNNNQTALGSGNRLRNAYPLFATQAVYEGQRAADPMKRVCILTRSAFTGQQRYSSIVWSGDLWGKWETLRRQIPAGLNFCAAGIPYWTTDTGGFFRPEDQLTNADYNELLCRWYEFSTFCPVMRVHGMQSPTEPWHWPVETQRIMRKYVELRYRLLPYLYSSSARVTREGYTLMRGMPFDFASDTTASGLGNQYMFGPSFLVAPVTEPKAIRRQLYLPAGADWYNFWTGERKSGGRWTEVSAPVESLPLFVRAGAIIPLGPVLQHTGEKSTDPIELRIYPGADGSFTLYDDQGDGYAYEKGAFVEIPIKWNNARRTLTLEKLRGGFLGMPLTRKFRVVIVNPVHDRGDAASAPGDGDLEYNGEAVSVAM